MHYTITDILKGIWSLKLVFILLSCNIVEGMNKDLS